MNGLIDRVTKDALRRGLRQGVLAGDGKWIALGALAWLVRFLMRRPETARVTETLRPGESIVVTNLGSPPRGRRARRAFEATTAPLVVAREPE